MDIAKIKKWMMGVADEYETSTELAEAAADEFDYYSGSNQEIPEDLFDLAADTKEELEKELVFASENQALQYLADHTGKKILIASKDDENKEYASIVFIQSADDFEDFQDQSTGEKGIDAFFGASTDEMFDYLMQWENGDRGEVRKEAPWGSSDKLVEKKIGKDTYVMGYNSRLGYAGLVRVEDAQE